MNQIENTKKVYKNFLWITQKYKVNILQVSHLMNYKMRKKKLKMSWKYMIRNFYRDLREHLRDQKKSLWGIYICITKEQSSILRSEKKLKAKIRKTRQISHNNQFLNHSHRINNKMLCPKNKWINLRNKINWMINRISCNK